MEFLTSEEFGKTLGLKAARIRQLCEGNRITGAKKIAGGQGIWLIPSNAVVSTVKRGRPEGYRKDGSDLV